MSLENIDFHIQNDAYKSMLDSSQIYMNRSCQQNLCVCYIKIQVPYLAGAQIDVRLRYVFKFN